MSPPLALTLSFTLGRVRAGVHERAQGTGSDPLWPAIEQGGCRRSKGSPDPGSLCRGATCSPKRTGVNPVGNISVNASNVGLVG